MFNTKKILKFCFYIFLFLSFFATFLTLITKNQYLNSSLSSSASRTDRNVNDIKDFREHYDVEANYQVYYQDWIKFNFEKCEITKETDRFFKIILYFFNGLPVNGNTLQYDLTYSINGKLYPPIRKTDYSPVQKTDSFTIIVNKEDFKDVNNITFFFLSPYFISLLDETKIYHYNIHKWHIVFDQTILEQQVFIDNPDKPIIIKSKIENRWKIDYCDESYNNQDGQELDFSSPIIKE